MRRLRKVLIVAVVALTAVAVVGSQTAGADSGGDEMDFVNRINGLRASKGLAPLAVKGELFDLSRAWSARMAAAGTISHNPSIAAQAPAGWTRLTENVGTGSETAQIFEALVNSPVHYANMVDPAVQSVGVGVVRSGSDAEFVPMTFMAGDSSPALVRKVVRVCTKNRRGRTVCARRA
ncbi:MAG: CAP domain-containing protein [Acidimicrobiales bacterium]